MFNTTTTATIIKSLIAHKKAILQTLLLLVITNSNVYTDSFTVRSMYDAMLEDTNIIFHKCHDPIPFLYPNFPIKELSYWHTHKGCFDQSGVFVIPNGKAYTDFCLSESGHIISFHGSSIFNKDNELLHELLGTHHSLYMQIERIHRKNICNDLVKKIPGTVALITDIGNEMYAHWMMKTLAKIALLEQANITYDLLYILHNKPYMKETLQILGIDASKIIEPYNGYECIQAETLIVPSIPAKVIPMQNEHHYANAHIMTLYAPPWHLTWLRNKILPLIDRLHNNSKFYPKVFLSRKDAVRKIINEDEVFAYFEQKGFKKYTLTDLSFLEQIQLFHQATHIVGTHGSNMTNIIFCKPETCVVELFQNQFDCTFWYLSQQLQLQHHCIKTTHPIPGDRYISTTACLQMIEEYVQKELPNL
ncbi:MAG: hypothetical protein CL947_03285 [Epsilonproteobacteria bacterium]|nr:hypothetical protein [Campylobacterota bacterium]|tara:strand:+ start:4 stop:1260 length:1257 start_codon:yes stop_codon:yes gene_type:complete